MYSLLTSSLRRWSNRARFDVSVRLAAARGIRFVVLQSCDERYEPLLSITAPINRAYARRHGYGYLKLVDNVSPIPDTANFNRYYLLKELRSVRSLRWALWLDADAMLVDHARRLESVTDRAPDDLLIACRGRDRGPWDINNGVFFFNMRHPRGPAVLDYLVRECERLPADNDRFRSDQAVLHRWLRHRISESEAGLLTRYSGEQSKLFNYDGPFVRHVLRTEGPMEMRIAVLRSLRDHVRRRNGRSDGRRHAARARDPGGGGSKPPPNLA